MGKSKSDWTADKFYRGGYLIFSWLNKIQGGIRRRIRMLSLNASKSKKGIMAIHEFCSRFADSKAIWKLRYGICFWPLDACIALVLLTKQILRRGVFVEKLSSTSLLTRFVRWLGMRHSNRLFLDNEVLRDDQLVENLNLDIDACTSERKQSMNLSCDKHSLRCSCHRDPAPSPCHSTHFA